MGATGRILPLAGGIVAAVVITGVAALAMSGPPDEFDPPIVDAAADEVGASSSAAPAEDPEGEAATPAAAKVDLDKIAQAHDSFPEVSKEARAATEARQAERVAEKKAQQEAEREEKAAAAEKERQAAEKEAAKKRAAEQDEVKDGSKHDETAKGDDPKKDKKADEPKDDPAKPTWWPEHHWAHAVSCTVSEDGQSVQGTWDLWLKHGGDWTYVAASPSPAEVSGTDGDKLKLVYPDRSASFYKEHDGKVKYRGEAISVTVANTADTSETRTFQVDLWVVAGPEGSCPA